MDRRIIKKLDPVKDQVIAAYSNGLTLAQIAEFHHVTLCTVRNFLKANFVPIRRRGPKRKK